MTREEFDTLCRDDVRRAVEENLGRDPLAVALDRRTPHAALVATQVKYLERARTKLPSYYAARCILPPRAFEQASSEACAAHKEPAGDAALDLTCGLGVDALALGRRFRRVVALERDPVLAAVAARNLRLLGAANVEVVCASAEEYLAATTERFDWEAAVPDHRSRTGRKPVRLEECSPDILRLLGAANVEVVCASAAEYLAATTERFDWVAADPDRRSRTGRKLVRLEECSPDILRLLPAVRRVGARLCLKNSPLFDVDEALRLFPTARIEAVSVHGECKELLVYDDGTGPLLRATALGGGSVMLPPATAPTPPPPPFDPTAYAYLFLPDVALQKMRLVRRALEGRADVWSENGFAFARRPVEGVPGRTLAIGAIGPFDAKALRRELRGEGIEIFKRDFPLTPEEIHARTGTHAGSRQRLAFTRIGGKLWTIRLAADAPETGREG